MRDPSICPGPPFCCYPTVMAPSEVPFQVHPSGSPHSFLTNRRSLLRTKKTWLMLSRMLMLPEDFPEFWIRVLPRQKDHAVGTKLTILRFLSSGICTVSLWLDFCGKEIRRSTYWFKFGWERVPTRKHLYVHKKGVIFVVRLRG